MYFFDGTFCKYWVVANEINAYHEIVQFLGRNAVFKGQKVVEYGKRGRAGEREGGARVWQGLQFKNGCIIKFAMEQPEQLDYRIYKEYEIVQKVGKGTYGVVYRARHKKSGRVVAIKKIIDAFQNLIDAKRTYRELNYLLQIHHPCIVRLETILRLNSKGFSHEPSTTRIANPPSQQERGSNTDKLFSKTFPQQKHVYAVFEFIETDLARALQICHELQPIQRKYIAYRLLHGIAFLHRSGLVHRDIKPSNILLNSELEIKICDFGMARLKLANEPANEGVLTEYVASRWYRPPEGLLGITTCDDSIDLWSVGCVIAELVLKSPLFPGKSTLDQLELILKGIGMPSAQTISKLASEQAQYVLRNFTFSKRCKFRALQETLSQCSAEEMDLIMNLLRFDPAERITAEEALRHEYFDEIKQLEGNLETYSKSYTVLRDDSTVNRLPQSEERNSSHPGIDHYRKLIDELDKFSERSTNRSEFTNYMSGNQFRELPFNIKEEIYEGESMCKVDFKEKSTKESDFVNLHKHHYLASNLTNTLVLKKEVQEKVQEVREDQSLSVNHPSKPKSKVKREKSKKSEEKDRGYERLTSSAHNPTNPTDKFQKPKNDKQPFLKKIIKNSQEKKGKTSKDQPSISNCFNKKAEIFTKTNQRLKSPKLSLPETFERKNKVVSQTIHIKSKQLRSNQQKQGFPSSHSALSLHHHPKQKTISKKKPEISIELVNSGSSQVKKLLKNTPSSTKSILTKGRSPKASNNFKRKS